jgi:hypothetical protein
MNVATSKQLWKLNDLAIKCQESKPSLFSRKRVKPITVQLPLSREDASAMIQVLMARLGDSQ